MIALFGATGCDTVARLAFSDRSFSDIKTSGMTAPAGQCQGVGADGQATVRFVLLDNQGGVIVENDSLGSNNLELNRSTYSFEDSVIFPRPDVACEMCDDSAFTCGTPPSRPDFEPSLKRCLRETEVAVNSDPRFVSSTSDNQLFGIMIEETSSMVGTIPEAVQNLVPDSDGDGTTDADKDPNLTVTRRERAADPGNNRKAVMGALVNTWKSVATRAQENFGATTRFGLWALGGSAASLKSFGTDSGTWTGANNGPAQADAAQARYVSDSSVSPAYAAVYESMATLLSDTSVFADPRFQDFEKVLVVVVDGPDELRLSAFDAQRVIDEAQANNVRLFIVHIDAAIDYRTGANDQYLNYVENPRYVESQEGSSCSADTDCKNFEECRPPTFYAPQVNLPVSESNGAIPNPTVYTESYCFPKRDENGRTGPIDDYAQIACATNGGYIYLKDAASLLQRTSWLPWSLDGLWEMDVTVSAFSRNETEPGESYQLQTVFSADIENRNDAYDFSQMSIEGGTIRPGELDRNDTRAVLFSAP